MLRGCFLGYCLYFDSKVDVVGYGDNFSHIREMLEDFTKERFKESAKFKKSSHCQMDLNYLYKIN